MRKKVNRSKNSSVPAGKFPTDGLRIVPIQPYAIAKSRWQPDPNDHTALQVTFTFDWIPLPQVTVVVPIGQDPKMALGKALTAIADKSNVNIVKLWREPVFEDIANVPLLPEP